MAWYWWALIVVAVCVSYVAIGQMLYLVFGKKRGRSRSEVLCNWPIYLVGLIIFSIADL